MKILLIVVALVLMIGGEGEAVPRTEDTLTYYTGRTLLLACNSKNYTDIESCRHYILGVFDGLHSMQPINTGFCLPNSVDTIQIALVIKLFITKHPEYLDYTASSLIYWSLVEAFPCPEK